MIAEFEKKDFSKLLKHGALEGHRWMKNTDSTAVRVYDRNLQAFPVTVDFYGPYALVVDYADGGMSDEDRTVAEDLISRFMYVEHDRIIWRSRKKREGREQHEKSDGSLRLDVRENGLVFETELMSYVDTGLFLDQALTRAEIRRISGGMRVLNLFSYTGSFSVYAAAGGAECVVSVDLSNVYTAWAERNLEKNGFLDEGKYRTLASDARSYLEEAAGRGERYDIVIFDPPAFSNSHKAEDFDVQKDYLEYLHLISGILVPGGVVVFSENLQGFSFAKTLLKPYWKTVEITEEMHATGFSAKRSGLRVWMLKKTAEMKEIRMPAEKKRRRMDEEKAERLSLDAAADEQAKQPETAEGNAREERDVKRPYGRRDSGDRGRRNGGYNSRGRDSWSDRGSRDGSYRSGRDRGYDRQGRYDDDYRSRPRYSERDRDGGYDRPRYRDDWHDRDRGYSRPGRYDDDYRSRPRYSDRDRYEGRERRPYGDKESYRQRDNWPGRREDGENYPRRRDRGWDNETGRMYRGERSGRYSDRRAPRYSETGEDRRPFGDNQRRRRNAPKPYGYDSFMITKNRDSADVAWLKNTEIRDDGNNE